MLARTVLNILKVTSERVVLVKKVSDKEPVLYPYFSGTLPNDVQVEREMYIDLLNASICEVIAGGNKHCGTYAISNILSLCFYSA